MNVKSKTIKLLRSFIALIKIQFKKTIKIIRTNNFPKSFGKEFIWNKGSIKKFMLTLLNKMNFLYRKN